MRTSRRRRLSSSNFSPALQSRRLVIERLERRDMLAAFDLLVFSKTAGFRHTSIDEGIAAIQALGATHNFTVTATEDASAFTAGNLANYEAVVFLMTTGDVLNAAQQTAFEQYIEAGGGWIGVHSAADTEYAWPWYGGLVGAYFESHPAIQQATVVVADQVHASTAGLPERWTRTDEWYNFQTNPRGDVHVLATLNEASYSGGADGFDHPIAWYHPYDGGRSWYTGLGHTEASYNEPLFLDHLLGGIRYAAGQVPDDGGATIDTNWQKNVLEPNVTNPMSLEIAPDGRVFFVEIGGAVRVHDPVAHTTTLLAQLSVYNQSEHGLLGIALDPDFTTNHWIYLYYAPSAGTVNRLSRFTLAGSQLDLLSEKILLTVTTDRVNTNHAAGSLAFGPGGELYLSTGDNTNPFDSSGFNPIDERPGRTIYDAQRSAGNANDLRGKILRIVPQADGTYTIPAGNLFPADGSAGRPEIFAMGNRNPFRLSVDQENGWVYWGDVGPDANNNDANRGPRGYDEINQARDSGNYGWPYFIGNNLAYREYDFATMVSGPAFNSGAPVNNSPNNTGAQNLPPAESAFIWYPYATTATFPELGTGGRTIGAGPVYHFDPTLDSSIKMPAYYDNTLFIYEWSRNWIKEVKLDSNGNILKINPFAVDVPLSRPIEVELGPDGALYVLEWGTNFSGNNANAQLVRIEFLGSPTIVTADFDENDLVDGADLLLWQRGLGLMGGAEREDGDADANGAVDYADLDIWETAFVEAAATPAAVVSIAAASSSSSSAAVDAALEALAGRTDLQSLDPLTSSVAAPRRWRASVRGRF